ncbi:MAG: porphobilinogen synthase, partial [Gemmatimonadales bacterium]
MSGFPIVRMRRLRRTESLRRLVREARLHPAQLVWPLFVTLESEPEPIQAMPGVSRHPVGATGDLAKQAVELGLGGVLLFGIPDSKDEWGSGAYDDEGVVQRAVGEMKNAAPDLVVVT